MRNRGQEYVNHSPKVSSWEGAEARSQVAPDSGSVHLLPGSRLQLLNDLCHPPPNAPFSHPQRQSLRTLEILPGAPPILSAEFKVLSLGVKALSDRTSGASRAPSFPVLPSRLQLFPDLPRLSFASRPLRTFCCREHGCPVLPCSDSPSGARTQACSTLGVPSHPPGWRSLPLRCLTCCCPGSPLCQGGRAPCGQRWDLWTPSTGHIKAFG